MKTVVAEVAEVVKDPFTGEPCFIRCLSEGCWIGGAESVWGSWKTPLYESEESLRAALALRAAGWDANIPAAEMRGDCPFDGDPVHVVFENGDWLIKGRLWYSGSFFGRREALWYLSMRNGVLPAFPRNPLVIKGEREPDLVAASQAVLNDRARLGLEAGHAAVDKFLRSREPAWGKRRKGR